MREGPQTTMNLTEFAQPAIFATSYLAFLSYKSQKSFEDCKYIIGHSVGEYGALTAAGWLNPLNTIKLLRYRGQLMQEACQGRKCGMLVVMETEEKSYELFKQIRSNPDLKDFICELGVHNSRKNNVFTGDIEILSVFSNLLKKYKVPNLFLRVSAAFHCSLLQKILTPFEDFLKNIEITKPDNKAPVVMRNYDMKIYEKKEEVIEGLVKQLDHPVKFYQSVKKVIENDEQLKEIIELASNKTQAKLISDIIKTEKIDRKINILSV